MLVVTIRRHSRSDAGTQGSATLQGTRDRFDTLERRDSIPVGTYAAYARRVPGLDHIDSSRRVYQLQGLPNQDRADIDVGEFAGDEALGMYCNLLGAIAFGFGFARRLPRNGTYRAQLCLQHSREAIAQLLSHAQGLGIFVDIIDLA